MARIGIWEYLRVQIEDPLLLKFLLKKKKDSISKIIISMSL
jgi:hypothetical protein